MRARTMVKDLLLLFVGLSLGVAFSDAFRPAAVVSAATEALSVVTTAPSKDGLVAYYFHGSHRCPTCRTIETLAHTFCPHAVELVRRFYADVLDATPDTLLE